MANKLWSAVNKGTYSGSTQYYVGDFVNYNGSYYTCIQNSLGNLPTNTSYWALVASKGDTGATGAQGPQGPQGPAGADGLDITWKGAYNNLTSYVVNDAVSYNGSSYICKLATTGNPPTDTTYWDLMAQKGTDGTGAGDVVGPSSSTNNNIVLFDGTSGKLIKDGGKGLPSGAIVGDTDVQTLSNKTLTKPNINGSTPAVTTDNYSSNITFDMASSNIHIVTLTGNATLAVSSVSVGQVFMIELVQDGTGSRTVTWWSTIKWAGGTAPTLTTTANKKDVFGFRCTSSGNYDGYVIGQNI